LNIWRDPLTKKRDHHTWESNWEDSRFSSFIIILLQKLEPKKIHSKEIIFTIDEEVEEMYFVTRGEVISTYYKKCLINAIFFIVCDWISNKFEGVFCKENV
jgi:hypothetical protein